MTGEIVVGYDGSPGSEEALRWAVREARARGAELTACLAWVPDYLVPQSETEARRRGGAVLALGLKYARSQLGSARVHPVVVRGVAAQVLRDYGRAAQMAVVGSRGRCGIKGQLLGSVSWQLATHGSGTVVVVRGLWRPVNHAPGPVVAGVDGSAGSRAALPFAFEEAGLRSVPLFAVCALAEAPAEVGGTRELEEDFTREMTAREKEYPDVTVLRWVSPRSPCAELLTAAAGAQLLVVGARGRDGVPGMLLGSVAQAVLHHALCPVAVVRPTGMTGGNWR